MNAKDMPHEHRREALLTNLRRAMPRMVWAVPIAALLIAGYLGLNAYAQQGIDVTVTFPSGAGVKPGSTRVIYQGIDVGTVTALELNKDGRRVDMTLRLIPRAARALVSGTTFFFVGAGNNITDVASLHAAIAGVTIGVIPSFRGRPTRHFLGLSQAPIITPGTPGIAVRLDTTEPGAIGPGTDVSYHGVKVGKVTGVHLTGMQHAQVDVFVKAPFDRFVRPSTAFWKAGALDVSFSGRGLNAHVDPGAALHGGIAFDTPEAAAEKPVGPDGRFPLYEDQGRATNEPKGTRVLYQTRFNSPIAGLSAGSPVTLQGMRLGSVERVDFAFDERSAAMSTTVTIAVFPGQLRLEAGGHQPEEYWRARTDAAMSALVAHGWRLRLLKNPPFIGPVTLDLTRGARAGMLRGGARYPLLPSDPATSTDLPAKASTLLDHIDQIPFARIGANISHATKALDTLTASPELRSGIRHLDATMAQLDTMMSTVEPKVGPLIDKLGQTADQLQSLAKGANRVVGGADGGDGNLPDAMRDISDAARSLRSLTDYLSRHPEAVLRGKAKTR